MIPAECASSKADAIGIAICNTDSKFNRFLFAYSFRVLPSMNLGRNRMSAVEFVDLRHSVSRREVSNELPLPVVKADSEGLVDPSPRSYRFPRSNHFRLPQV